MNWDHQYTPGDMWDYDETGTHIIFDAETGGQKRRLITHSGRNGFLYTFESANAQTVMAKPYMPNILWTAGIDQKTGKPVDYNPNLDIQVYSGKQNMTMEDRTKKLCPAMSGGNNYWPTAYSQKTKMLYIPSLTSCNEVTLDPSLSNKAGDWKGARFRNVERTETDIVVADPLTGEVKKRIHDIYPNRGGMLATAGGLLFTGYTDGTFKVYDDTSHEIVWRINVGTGFLAPPMTFEAGGKQYIGILSGLSNIARGGFSHTPELKEQRNQTLLWVFAL